MWIIKFTKLYPFGILLFYYLLVVINTCLQAQTLDVIPQFIYEYESNSEEYHKESVTLHEFEVGILGQYSKEKLNIQAHIGYHFIDGVKYEQSKFTSTQGLHFIRKDLGLGDKQRNYYISDVQIKYGDSNDFLYLNKWDKHWGPGIRSLTISNKIPTFPHFGFRWAVTDQIHLEYFHGQLRSGIEDISYLKYFTSSKSPQIMRNIAAHRLDWELHEKWNISISEMVIYANRSLEMAYFLPLIPFFPVQNYLNDTDNILMSADMQYLYQNNIRFYGVFLMDEWSPPITFDEDNHNWFGWQCGIDWNSIYLKEDRFRLEYTWTDHRIYHHRFEVNDYYSWGYPVGFWAGPHAEEIYMDYSFKFGDNQVQILCSNAKRGEFTDSMRIEQYGRPSNVPVYERFGSENTDSCGDCIGTVESKLLMRISVDREIFEKLDIYLQYTYVDWRNAGFNPISPVSEKALSDIMKHSMGVAFRYHY